LSIDTLGVAPTEHKIEQVLDHRIGDTGEVEYLIKWSGWSHVHNTWSTEAALSECGGERILQNYIKKSQHDAAAREHMLAEDLEALDIERQMQLDQLEEFKEVERVIEQNDDDQEVSFLCKWRHLPYDEATWEQAADILPQAQAQIDLFLQRQQQSLTMRVYKPGDRPQTFEPYEKQPEWLGSGDLKLRDYQLDGMNWLARNWTLDVNCILADEMGLGKTAQTISMLGHMRYAANVSGPFLVVVPLSTISNWQREFDMWLPTFNVIMYIGNARAREIIRAKELWQPRGRKSFVHKFNVLLTTYEMLLKDARHLKSVDWAYVAVDEAHRLKNTESQLYQCLVEFRSANRLLITGTPLQNSLGELWSLLHYLDRRKFETLDDFVTRYGTLSTQAEIAKLHAELRPHLLRRLKKDVEKSLPSKIERILRVDMSPMQKQIYRWVLSRNYNELNRNARGGSKMSLLNVLVDLKKTCNHPVLVPIGETELRQKTALLGLAARGADIDVDTLVRASGKLELLDRLLVRLREGGHRVLIFSQMVLMLDVLGDYLKLRGYAYQRLDGSCSRRQRQTAMQQFNAPDSRDFCFLLSTRAGGLGINLATADTVVIFDSDWNPQNDLQAEARAHRIGQTKTVNIYRLVCKDTVEENILERAKQKMVLDHLVIQSMDTSGKKREPGVTSSKRNPFKTNELSAIIKFGAQNLFARDNKPTTGDDANADTSTIATDNAPLPATIDLDEILSRAEVETGTEEPSMAEVGLFVLFCFVLFCFSSYTVLKAVSLFHGFISESLLCEICNGPCMTTIVDRLLHNGYDLECGDILVVRRAQDDVFDVLSTLFYLSSMWHLMHAGQYLFFVYVCFYSV
jgi:chromodomain-helicase-DNA-binding protein 1